MVNQQIIKQIENLEDELQTLKLIYLTPTSTRQSPPLKRTVKNTAGLIGKNFPIGVDYTRNIRKDWEKRVKKLGL